MKATEQDKTTVEASCLECGEKLIGRIDKKFCSDSCRVAYNNYLNRDTTKLVRNINRILRKNRRILETLNSSGKTRVSKDKLIQEGFNFNYFTSSYTTKEGAVYHYCYEQGYLPIKPPYYLLVIKKKEA